MKNEVIAGLVGLVLINAFLLGLAFSIGKTPFWLIVVAVLVGAWIAWFQDTVKNDEAL